MFTAISSIAYCIPLLGTHSHPSAAILYLITYRSTFNVFQWLNIFSTISCGEKSYVNIIETDIARKVRVLFRSVGQHADRVDCVVQSAHAQCDELLHCQSRRCRHPRLRLLPPDNTAIQSTLR